MKLFFSSSKIKVKNPLIKRQCLAVKIFPHSETYNSLIANYLIVVIDEENLEKLILIYELK
jgi:AICAR transformylase/IMP cyclohydrolase PurH